MSLYDSLIRPLLFSLTPENAHALTLAAMRAGLAGTNPRPAKSLSRQMFGLTFPSPVGLAAGFDKNAEVVCAAFNLGFGFVEVGTVTPFAQAGNPGPRVFRLVSDKGVINRLGFNNQGHAAALSRLERLRAGPALPGPVGVNIGANADSADKVVDYVLGVKRFAQVADYLTLNISSPNTKNLRDLQEGEALTRLLCQVLDARATGRYVPILVKVAPDLAPKQIDAMAGILSGSGIDGIIVSNTTTQRPKSLKSLDRRQEGGLSGAPLKPLALKTLKSFKKVLDKDLPIIGVGGITSAQDAADRLNAGASLVQLYTGLIYQGPDLAWRINRGLAKV